MTQLRMQKLDTAICEAKIDHVLLTSLASLRYFAGYTAGIETGPSPFSPVLGAFLWIAGEPPQLFLADMESSEGLVPGLEITPFESYTVEKPLAAARDLVAKLLARLAKLPAGRVGMETDDLPAAVFEPLRSRCPRVEFQDITGTLAKIRMIKDEEEISILREALDLCDLGQALVKRLAQRGMTEVELFAEVRKGMETRAGGRLPLLADLVSGPRTAQIGGPPTSRCLEHGDLIISDLVPRHLGYWGDTCNTCAVGEPTSEQQRLFDGIAAALAEGITEARPGVRACDLDASLRKRVLRLNGGYPHHSGHGLGVTWHEEPRIVPYNPLTLEPGMVIALEPGIYLKGRFGLRLEHTILVTEKGAEILSKFRHTL
jgi:Xaa-Pro aminopeptidase